MNAEVSSDISVQKLKINEQCATDSSVCGDLQNGRAGDCNGVKLEGAVREASSGNGKEDLDGAYVFINGIDNASEDSVEQNSVEPATKEDFGGDNGGVKVNGFCNRGDFEQHVTTDKAVDGQHCEGVTHDNGEDNLLVQVPTEDFVGNNGELKVNGCNGVGDFGVQETEEKAIEVQPHEGVSNGSYVNEVKPDTEVMASLRNSGLESAVHGEDDNGGVGIVVEEQIAPQEIPASNESSNVAAPALNDRKEQQYENAAEVYDQVGEALKAEPEEIAESYESSDVAAPASNGSLQNGEELSDQVGEVPKAEPEDIPESHESRDEPLENAVQVSGKFDEGQKAESEEAESFESSDLAVPTQSYRKEPLEDAVEVSDQLDDVSKAEPAVDDSISGDSKLQKECGCCMDDVEENLTLESASGPNIVVDEQESVENEREVAKSDLVLGQDLTDSAIPSSDVPLENVSGDPDQNVPMVSESSESVEIPAAYDSGHELTMSVMMQPTADATSIADESNPDLVVDRPEIASAADKSEPVQTPTEVELTPASEPEFAPSHGEAEIAPSHGEAETAPSHGEAETAPSHGEAETAPSHSKAETAPLHGEIYIASSPVKLESASIIVEAESDPALIKTESLVVEPQTGSPSAGEPLIGEVTTKSLDLGQEAKEQSAYAESLPSVDNGNVLDDTAEKVDSPVLAHVEDKSLTVAVVDEGSAPVIDYSGPAAEPEKGQIVSSDMDLEGADKDASLVPNYISSSCNITNDGESEICFGSISQKELSALPTNDRNTDELSSAVHAPISEQEHTKTANKVEKRFFNYLVKVPRYDDRDRLREHINAAQPEVDEKTRIRDAIKIEREKSRALRDELSKEVDAAIKEENAARESLNSKREEVTLVQEMIKAAKSTDDIDSRIRSMEHTMHHVTIDLKEEKQIMREIKQLRQSREQLSSNLGKQSMEQREQNESRLKILRKEEELLRDNLSRAELVTRTAKKNYYNEKNRFWELVEQFKTANAVRQDAYQLLKDLKDQLRKKEDRFFTYRKDQKLCFDLMNNKQRDEVSDKCVQQVEDLIKLWVDDSEFRDDYIRCNARSTLRRLGTTDGRVLGPNEEPQNVPAYAAPIVRPPVKDSSSSPPLPSPQGPPQSVQVEARSTVAEPSSTKPVEQQKKQTTSKANNAVKPSESRVVEPQLVREEVVVEVAEEPKRTNEEEEMARKAEELRKEEEAIKLKEQRRVEEKAKAEAALERKKRNSERAQARAAAKAQKEAELKEKEREKRLKKKERKNGGSAEASSEVESAPSSETSAETPKELENAVKERGVDVVTKRPQKPSHFIKQQNRVKSIPPPLRNRGKRRMQAWMWGIIAALVLALVFILFGRDLF